MTPRTATTRPHDRRITGSDRIYACITLRGKLVTELTRDRFSSLSSILAILRARVPYASGLARLCVRNMTRGWTLERPLMLYPEY